MTSRFTFLFQDGYLRQGKQCWGRYLLGVFSRHHYIKCVEGWKASKGHDVFSLRLF